MKKVVYLLIAVSLMLALVPAAAFAHTEEDPFVTDLIAGGGNPASAINLGEVRVWNDGETLYVKFVSTGDCLLETHVHVADSPDDIPQTKQGNPIPGQFEYSDPHACVQEYTYQIPLDWGFDTPLYIAAHAATGDGETAWGAGVDFPGKNWATYFMYTVQGELQEEWPEGGTLSVAYEDLPISSGNDWDYNDFVVDIDTLATFFGTSTDHDLVQMDFTVRPEAKIAGYTHVMHLDANTFACNGTYELYQDGSLVESGNYNDGIGIDVVLVPNTGSYPNEVLLTISFTGDCAFSFPTWDENLYHGENLFYDPYLHVNNTGEDIHQGDVRMLTVPVDWQWPTPDGNRICNVYPKVTNCYPGPPIFVPDWWTP